MDFKGIYFEKAIPNGKEETSIVLNGQYIQLIGMNHEEKWNTFEVEIEIGGANNHLIFFSPKPKEESEKSFYIFKDKEVIQYLMSLNVSEWESSISSHKKNQKKSQTLIATIAVSILLFFYIIFASRGFLAKKVVDSIPYSLEQQIGDKLTGTILPPSQLYQDKDMLKALNELLSPLSKTLPAEFQDFKVYISNSEQLNAFALPGGHIIFNLGALKKARSGTEILGVAAHEMAHVTERHVLRNLIQGLGMFTLVQLIMGDVTGILAILTDQGSFLLMRGFSRSMEEEADEIGFETLTEANIDPRGMAGFFELILTSTKISGKTGEVIEELNSDLNFLSTHPDTKERIKKINNSYEQLHPSKKSLLKSEFHAFKKIKSLIPKNIYKEKLDEDKKRNRIKKDK